jgi:FkbM family methyltransferase
MAFINLQHFRLNLSTFCRRIVYRVYSEYNRRFARGLPVYDLEVISLIKRLPQNAVCIDIGVNESQLFSFMVKHCQEGKIYGFEPIPTLFRYLVKRFSDKNVQLYPYALSDKEEETSFYYFPGRSGVSGMSRRLSLFPELKAEILPIQTKVLDQLLDLAQIDLIKIDVEGSELKVLEGAKQHIRKCRPVVVFECQNQGLDYFDTDSEQVFLFFRDLGYGVSPLKYYLKGLPPIDTDTLITLTRHRYEYQFVAWPV